MPNRGRELEWFTTEVAFSAVADGVFVTDVLYSATLIGARFIKGATVTRMLIDYRLEAAAVAQHVRFFWGITIVDQSAVIGDAMPDPEDLSDRTDWLVRGRLQTIQASLSDSSQWDTTRLDIRTQRILRSEEDVLLVRGNNNSGGAFVLNHSFFIRVLMRMP